MDAHDAVALIAKSVPDRGGTWSDLGAGTGTFTFALASLLGPEGRVYAIDRDERAIEALRTASRRLMNHADVVPLRADFMQRIALPVLDGALLANALHFVPVADQARVLTDVVGGLRATGRVVVVDYDGRPPNRWVPFPVSRARFRDLTSEVGLSVPTVVATRPSAFGGTLYAAYASREVLP
jgi:ubiquinone/menaquinone biosynthesis C-methylase UbiE